MRSVRFAAGLLGAALLLGGCASIGHPYNVDAVSSLVPGQTTEAQAVAAVGEPTSRSTEEDGTVLVTWLWSHDSAFGATADKLVVRFDATGHMLKVVHRGHAEQ
jgi:hypothetical protein